MLATATAVYEAVEPIVVWRTMFSSVASHNADQNHVSPLADVQSNTDFVGRLASLLGRHITSSARRGGFSIARARRHGISATAATGESTHLKLPDIVESHNDRFPSFNTRGPIAQADTGHLTQSDEH